MRMTVSWDAKLMFQCVAGPSLFRPLSQLHVSAETSMFRILQPVLFDITIEGSNVDRLSMSSGAIQMISVQPHSPRAKLSGWT